MQENLSKEYIEFCLTAPRLISDAICDYIVENISTGMVLEEEEDSELVVIRFYSSEIDPSHKSGLIDFIGEVAEFPEEIITSLSISSVASVSWVEEYKKSIKPLFIDSQIVIRPTWDKTDYNVPYEIIIEPKMAFGTGTHETTRSCLKIVREHLEPACRFLDFGCGSGILSILADKMEASYIKAIDYDSISVDNTIENFIINGVTTENEVQHGSLELAYDDEAYQFICANIIRSTIVEYIEKLVELTAQNGILVLSGLLNSDEPAIQESLVNIKMDDYKIIRDNEWSSFIIFKG